ncbi:hypothetical protein A0J51_03283 [Gluconobacter japonicus]|nr:hypothetical protein A0J51_03283 [Gluconobacter japonicus]
MTSLRQQVDPAACERLARTNGRLCAVPVNNNRMDMQMPARPNTPSHLKDPDKADQTVPEQPVPKTATLHRGNGLSLNRPHVRQASVPVMPHSPCGECSAVSIGVNRLENRTNPGRHIRCP